MGNAYPMPGPARASSTTSTWTRWSRSCATPSAATTRSRSPARPSTTRTWATSGTSTARRTSTARSSPTGSPTRKGWEALNFFYNTGFDADNVLLVDEPWSRPGDYVLLRAIDRSRLRLVGLPGRHRPRQRLGVHRCPRARVLAREPLLDGGRPPRDRRGRARADEGDGVPPAHERADARASWSTAATGCRTATTTRARSPSTGPAARRPSSWTSRRCASGRCSAPTPRRCIQRAMHARRRRLAVGQVVYTAVCNETGGMIDDATVFRLGDDNFRFVGGDPYDGVWLKEQAERLGLRAWVKPSTDQLHNLAVQGPRSREILSSSSGRRRRRPRSTSSSGSASRRAHRRLRRHPGRRLAHRLQRRARLRGLVPPRRRPRGVGRDLGGRAAARPACRWARGARHDAHRGGPDLRRLRVRRPGRPVRGRHRLHGRARHRRGLRRQGRARRAQGASAAHGSSGSSSRATRSPATATSVYVGRRRVGVVTSGMPQPDAASARRAVPDGGPVRRARHRRSRSASSTGCRSASRRRSCASRSTTPTRRGRAQ